MRKAKVCWVAKETKKGWMVYLAFGEKLTFPLSTVKFQSAKDVKKALVSSIVFVEMDK